MKRTNTNEFKAACYRYLIDCMNDDEAASMSDAQKVKHINRRVRAELPHVVERGGFTKACEDWLSGLGMGIDYTNTDIIGAAYAMHGDKPGSWSDKVEERVIDNWFHFMGCKLAELCRRVVIEEKAPIPS